jgi:hypothetical protein
VEFEFLLKIAIGIVGSLLGNLIFGSGSTEQAPPNRAQEQMKPSVVVERRVAVDKLQIPSFVTSVPSGHFAGVSAPSRSLAEARRSAVNDVVRQVLGSIGMVYEHKYVDRVSGSVRGRGPGRVVDDRLQGFSHGVVLGLEENVVKSSWYRDSLGRYVYFVLARYPEEKIREMRRLSRGAKIVASVASENGGDFRLKVSEVNGVSVMILSVVVKIKKRNRFSKFISFYMWHVPEGSEHTASVAFESVRVCGNSQEVVLSIAGCNKGFKDYLLGAKLERVAVLKGHDELGRVVSGEIVF